MADAIGVCGATVLAAPAANGTTTTTGVTTQASGSVFLVGIGYAQGVGPNATSPVTDSKSNTYTKLEGIASSVSGLGQEGVEWYYSSNASPAGGATHTFSIKIGAASGDVAITALEVTGLSQTADQASNTLCNQSNTANQTTLNSVAMTTTNADDILVALGINDGNAAQTQAFSAVQGGGTWTIPTGGSNNNTTFSPSAIAYQLVEATGTYQTGYNTGAALQSHFATGIMSMTAAGVTDPFPAAYRHYIQRPATRPKLAR